MRFIWTPILIVITLTGILGFFQNCTPAVPFGNTDHYQALVNSPIWPYELGVDQVAYMSCSEQEDIANDGTFFTFRIGAFDSRGVRLSQTYRDNVGRVINTDVPNALNQAYASSRTRITFAVRTLDNLQLNYRDEDNGDDGLEGSDYDYFFPVMGNSDLNNMLWYMQPGDYLRTFAPAQLADDYRFEGELRFMKSQIMENDLRAFFNQRGILTVSWAEQGKINPIGAGSLALLQELAQSGDSGNVTLPPPGSENDTGGANLETNTGGSNDGSAGGSNGGNAQSGGGSGSPSVASAEAWSKARAAQVQAANNDVTQNIFGVAVQPRFKQPGNNPGPDLPPRVLSSINDVVVDERMRGELQAPWECPNNMQFMIVLPEDAIYQDANSNTIVRCAMDPDPVNPPEELKIIRQSIYAEDFYVDRVRRCIVPKPDHTVEGSCYGRNSNTQLTHIINYDSFASNGCGFGNVNGLCPHFASVCFRQ